MVTELEDDWCYTHVLLSNNELLVFRNGFLRMLDKYLRGSIKTSSFYKHCTFWTHQDDVTKQYTNSLYT